MTAQQAIKEMLRQIERLELASVKRIHPTVSERINGLVSQMSKFIEIIKVSSGRSPGNLVPPEMEEAIVNQNRQVEYLLTFQRDLPPILSASSSPQDALMVYIELSGLEVGFWGLLFERLIKDRISAALQADGIGKSAWGFAAENFYWFVLDVSDKARAFPVVTAELENLEILRCCQIGHYDGPDLRILYAHASLRPFSECMERALKLILKGLGSLPGSEPPRRF